MHLDLKFIFYKLVVMQQLMKLYPVTDFLNKWFHVIYEGTWDGTIFSKNELILLTMSDYFLWGHLMERIYEDKPRNLKESMKLNVFLIDRTMSETVNASFYVQKHITGHWKYIWEFLFHTHILSNSISLSTQVCQRISF